MGSNRLDNGLGTSNTFLFFDFGESPLLVAVARWYMYLIVILLVVGLFALLLYIINSSKPEDLFSKKD